MKVIIDRIEGGFAVAELSKGKWADIPVCLVPGVREGDVVSIEIDAEETEKRKKIISEKMKNIFR